MRAAVLTDHRRATLACLPRPEPGPGEIRLRIEGSGVCGSDLAVWQGRPWFTYPREPGSPGHEAWGCVDAAGRGVEDPPVGARVAALCTHAFADYDVAAASTAVELPAQLDGEPFPAEPLACALNVFRRSGIGAGDTVAVLGVGFLGALLVQLAAAEGATVIACSRRPFALEIARAMGAAHAISAAEPVVESVLELTGGRLCDVTIEAAGSQATLDLAGPLTRVRGRIVIAGYHQGGPRQVNLQLWNWRGLDVVNAHERDPAAYVAGMREAVAAVCAGRLTPQRLYTHRVPLDEVAVALACADERPDGFLKALVVT